MHALAVFLLLAPPAPARPPAAAPEPSWGELRPGDAPPAEAAPVDAVPTPAREEAEPPPPVVEPAPPPPQPVVQPPPPAPEPARPDRPIRWRLGIKAEVGATRLDSPKWYAVSTNRIDTTAGLSLNFDLRPGGGRLYVGPTLGFRAWGERDYLHAVFSHLRVRELLAGARLSIAALDGLDVFLQARGGPVFTLHDLGSGALTTDTTRAVTAAGETMAGLSLYLPKRWLPRKGAARVTGGFELAAGYAYRGPQRLRATPLVAEDDIPTTTADFGSVPLRGVVWHLGVFIRFM